MGNIRVLVFALSAALVLPVAAQAITVTTFADENGGGASCSLREAVTAINNAASFGGCTFSSGDTLVELGTGTYLLEDQNPNDDRVNIIAPMTIAGDGVGNTIIQRDSAGSHDDDMLFVDLQVAGTVNLHDFTVTGSTPGAFGFNTAINYIATAGSNLVMTDVTVRDNVLGGLAAFNIQGNTSATATLTRVVFQNNVGDGSQSFAEGGGMFCRAQGSSSIPSLALTDVIFTQNTAAATGSGSGALGGGLGSEGCSLALTRVTFDRNTVSAADIALGGGLFITDYAGSTTTVTLINVTFSANSAKTGGGLFEGVSFSGAGSGFSVNLANVTFAGDTASVAGDHIYQDSAAAGIRNVLFGPTAGSDCASNLGTLTPLGGNMDSDGSCGAEQTSTTSGLAGALADNGGFTPTLALSFGGSAVDAGVNAGCTATDQRGQARPQDGDGDSTATCDVGAYELALPGTVQFSAPTYTVNENGVSAVITVTRTGGSSGPISVIFATANGTATAGSDYTTTGSPLTWADGDTTPRTIDIPITDDPDVEGNETVLLSLTGSPLGTPSAATLTIVDDDGAAPGASIPTSGPWGLGILLLSLAGAGAVTLRLRAHP